MNIRYIQESGKDYIDKEELAKAINVSCDTAKKYIQEVENLVIEGFYPRYSILRKEKVVRVNYHTVVHYLTFANLFKEKNSRKLIPQLDIGKIKEFLGHQRKVVNI